MRWLPLVAILVLGAGRVADAGEDHSAERLNTLRAEIATLQARANKLIVAEDFEAAALLHREIASKLAEAKTVHAALAAKRKTTPEPNLGEVRGAIDRALVWLARVQDVGDAGMWDANNWMKHAQGAKGAGRAHYDIGVTGLALLAFLNNGYTDRGGQHENRYAKNVRLGLRFLLTSQDEDGCFGIRASQHYIYNHIIATNAVIEAFHRTNNPRYRKPSIDGVKFLLESQNKDSGWRYGVRPGESDTSVTSWAVHALRAAENAGLDVDRSAFAGALKWLGRMTNDDTGRIGYLRGGGAPARPEAMIDKFPGESSEAMTAAGLYAQVESGADPDSLVMQKGAALMLRLPPVWKTERIDMVYWLYGTRALLKMQHKRWPEWRATLTKTLLSNQQPDGSWSPDGPWGPDGGRIYSTAMMALSLQAVARTLPKPGG